MTWWIWLIAAAYLVIGIRCALLDAYVMREVDGRVVPLGSLFLDIVLWPLVFRDPYGRGDGPWATVLVVLGLDRRQQQAIRGKCGSCRHWQWHDGDSAWGDCELAWVSDSGQPDFNDLPFLLRVNDECEFGAGDSKVLFIGMESRADFGCVLWEPQSRQKEDGRRAKR